MEHRLIDAIRKYYTLPDSITDQEISEKCANTYGAGLCKLSIAMEDFKTSMRSAFPGWLQRIFR